MSNDLNPQARRRFGRNFLTLALGTAASRGAGFARELATAAWVGGGDAMDRFVVAFTIPTLFRRILGEEMIERAVMPTVKSIHALGDSRRAWAVTWQLGIGLVAFLLIVLGILWTNTEWLAHIVGPGIVERDGSDLMVPLIRLILPFLVIIGMAAFVGGILLYSDMVRIYALAPMGLSIGVIAALIRKGTSSDATTLAIGFLLGGCLQFMALVAVFLSSKYRRDHGVQWRVRNGLTRPEARRISSQTAWVFMQSFAQKSVEIVDRRLASLLLSGSVSALWYAARLVQLPEAILGLAAGRAGLSAMAEKQAKGQIEQLAQLVHHVIEKTLLFMAPVAAFCFVASWKSRPLSIDAASSEMPRSRLRPGLFDSMRSVFRPWP